MVLETKELYSRSLLTGKRWNRDANKAYVMPGDLFKQAMGTSDLSKLKADVAYFVSRHYLLDQPRITKLQRYYLGDNDIHYWRNSKAKNGRADNRIASGFAKFITNMRTGYMLGKPIQLKYDEDDGNPDEALESLLKEFNSQNDASYHDKVMKTNLSTTGRAYELLYAGEATEDENGNFQTPEVKLRAIDPATAFVVYDTSIDRKPLFGVRYYSVNFNDELTGYVDVYTDNVTYHFQCDDLSTTNGGDYTLINQEKTSFGAVPLTEFVNNENRTGDWEAKLDEIDAYDLAMSEMANSEEDFANAKLMISGDIDFSDNEKPLIGTDGKPILDKDGAPVKVPAIDTKDPFIMLKPSVIPGENGVTVLDTKADYLTKQLNEAGWKTYIDQLTNDIHKDTNTPDTTDDAFSGQSSGVALMYKLFGEDQERSMQEALYTRGIMRRLRLLGAFWKTNREIRDASLVEHYEPVYHPNLPRNNADIVQMLVQLGNTGLFSQETLREFAQPVTGLSADAEANRVENEDKESNNPYDFNVDRLQGANPIDVAAAKSQLEQEGVHTDQPAQPMDPAELLRQLQHGNR